MSLIKIATALGGSAKTRNLVLLNGEVIVCEGSVSQGDQGIEYGARTICDLAAKLDVLFGIYDDLLFTIDRDDLSCAVGIARVVDETSG